MSGSGAPWYQSQKWPWAGPGDLEPPLRPTSFPQGRGCRQARPFPDTHPRAQRFEASAWPSRPGAGLSVLPSPLPMGSQGGTERMPRGNAPTMCQSLSEVLGEAALFHAHTNFLRSLRLPSKSPNWSPDSVLGSFSHPLTKLPQPLCCVLTHSRSMRSQPSMLHFRCVLVGRAGAHWLPEARSSHWGPGGNLCLVQEMVAPL